VTKNLSATNSSVSFHMMCSENEPEMEKFGPRFFCVGLIIIYLLKVFFSSLSFFFFADLGLLTYTTVVAVVLHASTQLLRKMLLDKR
jgi:hypothetical protein